MKGAQRYVLTVAGIALIGTWTLTVALASTAPGLGTAAPFAILAGTTVTNSGNSVVNGDLGVSPGTAVTGFPPGTLNGAQHTGNDPVAISAKNDLTTAYNDASSSPCNFDKTGQNLGGQTLTPGTYCQTTAPTLTGTVTLSGDGVFIFQVGGTLVTAPGATVSLINGAQPCNVFWQVGSSATLDTTTTFVGTIMAQTSISLNNAASIAGRALAQTGQVSLINNQVTVPTSCNAATAAGPTATASPTPSASASPSPSPTPSTPGLPRAGGGPSRGGGYPLLIALISGILAGTVGAGVSARVLRRA